MQFFHKTSKAQCCDQKFSSLCTKIFVIQFKKRKKLLEGNGSVVFSMNSKSSEDFAGRSDELSKKDEK